MRGAFRDGRSSETGLLTNWPEEGPEVLWRQELGDGYSGVVVDGGSVVTMFGAAGDEWAAAFDARTGAERWRVRTDSNFRDAQGGGPRSTPAIADGIVYAVGAQARLFAIDLESGEVKWQHDLRKEYGAQTPEYGYSASPLVDGDVLVVDAAGKKSHGAIAFDRHTGKVLWHADNHRPAYSAPLVVTIGGVRQYVFFVGEGLISLDAADGRRLWMVGWQSEFDVNAAMPVFVPASGIFISSGYSDQGALIQVVNETRGFKAYQLWKGRTMKNDFHPAVLDGGQLYGFDGSTLKCIDVLTGDELWRARHGGYARGSLLWADGHLLVLGGQGKLGLIEATPDEFRLRGSAKILTGSTWSQGALADGVFYARDPESLVAVRVGHPPATLPVVEPLAPSADAGGASGPSRRPD